MLTWNYYMFWLASCLFVCIVMMIAFHINRLSPIIPWNVLILRYYSFFRKFNLYATSKDQNKIHNLTPKRKNSKILILATLELFHTRLLVNILKTYDIIRDFGDSKFSFKVFRKLT